MPARGAEGSIARRHRPDRRQPCRDRGARDRVAAGHPPRHRLGPHRGDHRHHEHDRGRQLRRSGARPGTHGRTRRTATGTAARRRCRPTATCWRSGRRRRRDRDDQRPRRAGRRATRLDPASSRSRRSASARSMPSATGSSSSPSGSRRSRSVPCCPTGSIRSWAAIVGLTLVGLGLWVLYSVYRYARGGETFRLRSRWMLVFDGARYGWRRLQARLHGHEHVEPLEMSSYGTRTALGVGMIHGVGAETGTQVLLIAAVGGASSAGLGVPMLFAFVLGLLISNFVLVVVSSVGFVASQTRETDLRRGRCGGRRVQPDHRRGLPARLRQPAARPGVDAPVLGRRRTRSGSIGRCSGTPCDPASRACSARHGRWRPTRATTRAAPPGGPHRRDRAAAAGDPPHRPRRGSSAGGRRRVTAVPHRGRRDRDRVRDGRRDRRRVRLVPALRRAVRRAALHARGRRSGGVAQPAPAVVRGDRHRSPGGAAGRARQRRDAAGRGVAGPVPDQPHAGDGDERGGRPAGRSSTTC